MEDQVNLFNKKIKKDWEKEWKGMPEFKYNNESAFKQLIVSFRNQRDFLDFANLIKQKIYITTPSIWFPVNDREKPSNYLYTYIEDGTKP